MIGTPGRHSVIFPASPKKFLKVRVKSIMSHMYFNTCTLVQYQYVLWWAIAVFYIPLFCAWSILKPISNGIKLANIEPYFREHWWGDKAAVASPFFNSYYIFDTCIGTYSTSLLVQQIVSDAATLFSRFWKAQ